MLEARRSGAAPDLALSGAIALLWAAPALPRFASHLRDGYDASMLAWTVAWTRHAVTTDPRRLYDANLFAPVRGALATSDPVVGYGLLSLPFAPLGPVLAFNLTWLLAAALSLFFLVRLARHLGASRPAAFLGAAAAGLGSLSGGQLGYLSFSLFGGAALLVLLWRRLLESGSAREAAFLGIAAGAFGLVSMQLLAFAAAGVGLLALGDVAWLRGRPRAPLLARTALAAAVALAILSPSALALARVRSAEGALHPREEMLRRSARLANWATTSADRPGQAAFLPTTDDPERPLYPGTAALALAAAACVAARRSPLFLPGAVLALAGFALSFGPRGPGWLLVNGPLAAVYGGVRAYTRFALLTQVGLALLGAAGAGALLERWRRRGARAALAGAAGLLVFLDVRNTTRLDYRVEPRTAADALVERLPSPVLHLPFRARATDARWLLASVPRMRPVVNGYGTFIPRRHRALVEELHGPALGAATLERLRAWPVGTLVVHEHALPLPSLAPTLRMVAAGLRNGTLTLAGEETHAGGRDAVLVFGTGGAADPAALLARADAAVALPEGPERDFLAALEAPAANARVRGDLAVRGWSRTEEGDVLVADVTIDGERRVPLSASRGPRPDVCAALPALGDCARAGYEVRFAFLPGDDGDEHELRVVFLAPGGRHRTLERRFFWSPPAAPPPRSSTP